MTAKRSPVSVERLVAHLQRQVRGLHADLAELRTALRVIDRALDELMPRKTKPLGMQEAIEAEIALQNTLRTTPIEIKPDRQPKTIVEGVRWILEEAGKPLGLQEIAQHMEQKRFLTPNPKRATVHRVRSAIHDSVQFRRYDRGLYGLMEWKEWEGQ